MTDPKHAHHIPGKGRYYNDPAGGPDLISVTNVLDHAAKHALVPWAAKVVAEHAMDNLPRLVLAARNQQATEQALRDLKGQVEVVREKASDLGTRVHHMAASHILDQAIPADDEAQPYLDQYEKFLTSWGIDIGRDIDCVEITVLNRRENYAGTLDLIARLPLLPALDGKPPMLDPEGTRRRWLIDIKTSATKPATTVYDTFPLQLVALRHGQVMLAPDDTEVQMPSVAGVAVLNLRPNDHALIPLPAGTAEIKAFLALKEYARWAHTWHDLQSAPDCPRPFDPTTGHRPKRARKTAATKKAASKTSKAA